MLNLITQDLEKLQELPKHLSKLGRNNRNWYSCRRSLVHKVGDYYPWTIVTRIIEAYVGKPFNDAFSYYCTKVPKYQQYKFLEQFENNQRRWYDDYKVDDDGIIRKVQKDKPIIKYIFYSDDYVSGWRHKETEHMLTHEQYRTLEHRWGWWKRNAKKPDLSQYELVTLQGWKKEFKSPADHEFIRLHAERQKRKAKEARLLRKQQEAISYSFLTKEEKEREKLMKDNELVRDNHGFDETVFIDREYHGQKRKWKE